MIAKTCKVLILSAAILFSGSFLLADTPEQTEQYRYALGLIQRHLYEEAGKVLNRLLDIPAPFSQTDGAIFWLAECEYRQKNFQKAIGFYNQVLKDFPNSIFRDRSAYGLAWAHSRDNNPKSAVEAFAKVRKNDINLWIDANMKRGFLMVKFGMDTEQTIRVYEELLKEPLLKDDQRFEANLQIGIGKFNQSVFPPAIEHFDLALKLAPEDKKPAIIYYLAEAKFRSKDFAGAGDDYARLIAIEPDSTLGQKGAYSMAWCQIKLGKPESAVELFSRQAGNGKSVVQKDSLKNLIELLMNLHRYEEAVNWAGKAEKVFSGKEKADISYIKALALSRTGEFEKSLAAFSDFRKEFSDHIKAPEAAYQAGLVNISLGRFNKAIELFAILESEKTEPDLREKAIYRIGECFFNLGNIKEAGDSFNKVIKLFPQGSAKYDALYQIGELAYLQGSYADALLAFEAISASSSELKAQALFRAGEVLMRAQRYEDAIARFTQYLEKFPEGKMREDAIFKTGLSWLELKDQGQALAAFSQLLDAKGYFRQEARFQIAEIARELGNHPLAIQHYKAITAEETGHPLASRARRAVGISLYLSKDFAAAIETFRAVLQDYPSTDAAIPESRLWLGKSLVAAGDTENGILEVLKVPVLYPGSAFIAEAFAEAARAYAINGNLKKSLKMWEEVLKNKPSEALEKEARAKLQPPE
ncbi:MAG: tetratricopeptide repeat protein [Candidatus Riflebacteria bacterium]